MWGQTKPLKKAQTNSEKKAVVLKKKINKQTNPPKPQKNPNQ